MRPHLVLLLFVLLLPLYVFATGGIVSVKDFGAKGDGVADDTEAIKKAVMSAEENGIIYFPPGKYRVKETIEVKGKCLLGNPKGAWNADMDVLPTLIIDHLEGPGLHLLDGASVSGRIMRSGAIPMW